MKWIGIICLAVCMTYYHPSENPIDYLFVFLFWIGLNLFVDGKIEENK